MHTPCPYTTIGADITVTSSCAAISTNDSSRDAPSRLASANLHLQEAKRKKLRRDRGPDVDYPHGVEGEQTIGELMAANMLMIPFTLDPHGRWGPLMGNFLNQITHNLHYMLRANKQNAAAMQSKITRHPCPIGILKQQMQCGSLTKTNHSLDTATPHQHHQYTPYNNSVLESQKLLRTISKLHIKQSMHQLQSK